MKVSINALVVSSLSAGVGAAALLTVLSSKPAYAGPPVAMSVAPLTFTTVGLPGATLDADTPSNVIFTLTSSGGPFCVVGLRMDAWNSGSGDVGSTTIALSRIDGAGQSYDSIELLDGSSQGASPQDLIVSYGTQICATHSLEFHATQWYGAAETTDVYIYGTGIVMAASGVTVTATSEAL